MTKREHDHATKINYGAKMGGRGDYRFRRGFVSGRDFVTDRAESMAWRNSPVIAGLDGQLATLALASKYRAVAIYRASAGLSLLGA